MNWTWIAAILWIVLGALSAVGFFAERLPPEGNWKVLTSALQISRVAAAVTLFAGALALFAAPREFHSFAIGVGLSALALHIGIAELAGVSRVWK